MAKSPCGKVSGNRSKPQPNSHTTYYQYQMQDNGEDVAVFLVLLYSRPIIPVTFHAVDYAGM